MIWKNTKWFGNAVIVSKIRKHIYFLHTENHVEAVIECLSEKGVFKT